jgi:acyl-CoA synthetase (AMP-forming)/AMP-acid ligase II
MLNLNAFITYHATRAPERTAIIYQDLPVSYGEFHERIRSMAALMHARGIGPDDVVAVFMKNSPAFLEIAFAASYLGAIFLPINFRLAAAEAEYILGDSRAKLLFVDEEFKAVQELATPKVVVNPAAQADSRALSEVGAAMPEPHVRKTDDLVRLMYTSGTTSHPKGVMHTYDNLYWKSMAHVIALGLTAEDRLLVVGPLYHVGAFDLPGIAVLWIGGTLCIHREFDPEKALSSIEHHKLTCGWMAPVMLSRTLTVENTERFDLSSFRWCIGGGEKTPESRIRDFTRVFKAGRYIDGYGLTETCSGDTLMEPGREIEKIGSTGRALAHVEIRIVDENGTPLPPNSTGEICLRGPKVTKGYWNAPEKAASSFYGEWFRTGDLGHLDEDGFLYITDRAKDMILTGAENVASSEVEEVLYKLPQVTEVAVIGAPDERWGERVVAVVVPRPGETLTFEQMDQHCRQYLAGFKVPKELRLVEALPRNPSGKILKRVLRADYSGS